MNFVYVHKADLRRWQKETLKIQQAFQCLLDRFAVANWCGGGFLIGAVREGGFLYWDNDIDVFIKHGSLKEILRVLWKERFMASYEIWSQVDGYWQVNGRLNHLLKKTNFDEKNIDIELKQLSKGMFKIFSPEPLEINLYTHDFNQPETFVKVKQFTRTNITRFRDAHKNDGITNGQIHRVLANICILPMIEVTKCQYVLSTLSIMSSQVFAGLHLIARDGKHFLFPTPKPEPQDVRNGNEVIAVSKLDKQPKDEILGRMRIAAKILIRLFSFTFGKSAKDNQSHRFWAYKPLYFRIIVLPFNSEDLFPTQKIKIENCMINVPKNYENILKVQFGDYVNRPPLEDRVALPFFTESDRQMEDLG